MRLSIIAIVAALFLQGCRPLGFPMLARLEPDRQAEVDSVWTNMLKPVDRLDRQTLLDCVVMLQLYQHGVDRFTARSVKSTSAGAVEMSINFDRAKPESDQFVLRVVGPTGKTLRQEKWSAKELFDQYGMDETGQAMPVAEGDRTEREAQLKRRMERFIAATQPAG